MTSKSEFVVAFVGDRPTFSEAQVLENLNKSAMPLTYVFPRKNGRDFPVLWVLNQISLVCINNKLTARFLVSHIFNHPCLPAIQIVVLIKKL